QLAVGPLAAVRRAVRAAGRPRHHGPEILVSRPMTVSQNRERAAPYREDRQYFLRPTRIGRWRRYLTILALVVTLGYAAIGFAFRGRLHRDVSRGPVAAAHAAWNDRCAACHESYGGT